MDFTVLTSVDTVRRLSDEWTELLNHAQDPDPFVSPNWLLAWWDAFGDSRWSMQFGVVRHNGVLVGIAPLYVSTARRWGRTARVLRFWGNSYSNRVAILVSAEIARDAIQQLAACLYSDLTAAWDFADLGPMLMADQTTQLLVAELRSRPTGCAMLEGHASPYRDLPTTSELLEESLGAAFKKSLRRKINKADRANVSIDFTSNPQRLADAMRISEDTWQHKAGSGIATNLQVKTFYERTVERFGESGQLQLAYLSVDGAPVAFELNITFARTVYNLKVGYRSSCSGLSPGIVLRHAVLRHAIEQGFEAFDFLGVNEGYKLHWTSGTRLHGNIFFVHRRDYWWCLYLLRFAAKPFVEKWLPWVLEAKRWLQQRLRLTETGR